MSHKCRSSTGMPAEKAKLLSERNSIAICPKGVKCQPWSPRNAKLLYSSGDR